MDYILFDDFKKMDLYQDFIRKNLLLGETRVQVMGASGAVPIEGARVEIYKDIGELDVLFFQGETDSNGVINHILLPAPVKVPIGPLEVPEYSIYFMNVEKDGFQSLTKYSFMVMDGVEGVQNIMMKPLVDIEKN